MDKSEIDPALIDERVEVVNRQGRLPAKLVKRVDALDGGAEAFMPTPAPLTPNIKQYTIEYKYKTILN
jgi:hypothetical protein